MNKKPRCNNKKHNVAILHKRQQDIDIFPRGIRRIFLLFPSTKGLLHTIYIWDTKKARGLTYFPSLLVILLKHLTEVARWKKHLFAFQQNWSTCVVCTYTCMTITPKPFGPSTCQHILEQIARRAIFKMPSFPWHLTSLAVNIRANHAGTT